MLDKLKSLVSIFNMTHLEHTVITLGIQLAIGSLLFIASVSLDIAALCGGLIAFGIFLGREISQHEYKLATKRGWSWGQKMPVEWYEGFTEGWSTDSILDVAVSFSSAMTLFYIATQFV